MTADPVLLYDGDCAFCTTSVRTAERLLGAGHWRSVPFQAADLDRLAEFTGGSVSAERAEREVLWITPNGRVYGGAQAAARALMRAGGVWAYAGAALTLPGIREVAAGVYHVVSVNRHRLPGGTPACAMR
jgi:predicted DCC family thiol-disulfide oxidoreductase YuxK